jgi:quinoprotein dehydrogenase-associated probable ABC transporter substrate-binding protein
MVAADADYQPPPVLKVCQDPNNLPFSNDRHEGIENRLAELFGRKLGVPVEYFSFPQRLAFVRNTIRYRLPGQDYRCDIMMGVPERFGQVSTTSAYYRSTYALVYRKGGPLDGVGNSEQFVERARTALKPKRLGIHDKSPASAYLNKYSLTHLARLYQMMSPDPDSYPGQLIERELVDGVIDAAIVWGPVAGYYGNVIQQPELVVVPLVSEPGVRFDFAISMGVRYGEPQWKGVVERFLSESRAEIIAILREFHVPLVDELGELLPPDQDPAAAGRSALRETMPDSGELAPPLAAQRDRTSAAAAGRGPAPA